MTEEEKERTLEIVTQELGEADAIEKAEKKKRDERRLEFFALAEKAIASRTLAQKTISVAEFESEVEVATYLERHYPTWNLLGFESREDDILALLEENPKFQAFPFVNPLDGKVYRKQIVGGSPILDEEQLREADPDLWERISYVPPRQVKQSEEIEPKDLAKMQPFIYPSPPKLQLAAPRTAKEKELETGQVQDPE